MCYFSATISLARSSYEYFSLFPSECKILIATLWSYEIIERGNLYIFKRLPNITVYRKRQSLQLWILFLEGSLCICWIVSSCLRLRIEIIFRHNWFLLLLLDHILYTFIINCSENSGLIMKNYYHFQFQCIRINQCNCKILETSFYCSVLSISQHKLSRQRRR